MSIRSCFEVSHKNVYQSISGNVRASTDVTNIDIGQPITLGLNHRIKKKTIPQMGVVLLFKSLFQRKT